MLWHVASLYIQYSLPSTKSSMAIDFINIKTICFILLFRWKREWQNSQQLGNSIMFYLEIILSWYHTVYFLSFIGLYYTSSQKDQAILQSFLLYHSVMFNKLYDISKVVMNSFVGISWASLIFFFLSISYFEVVILYMDIKQEVRIGKTMVIKKFKSLKTLRIIRRFYSKKSR